MAVSPQPALYPTGNDAATSAAIALLIHYFDLAPASAQLLVKKWLTNYPAIWVRAAVTEALYQGRYKPFSVEQILSFWQRRGKSIPHFNKEFETIIAVPLQGSFKTEADVAIERNDELKSSTAAPEPDDSPSLGSAPILAPSTPLAQALEAAEQEQSSDSTPLPRPRLMLPGELPGTGLAQRFTVPQDDAPQDEAPQDDAPQTSPSSPQLPASETEQPGASALSQPQGFDGIIDPRPRPQITQGPDSALIAKAKSKQIQPPPIGRFTPAADPSGFASRLKTVVEQAIAKTQAKKEEVSLENAIASQLASDPVLGQTEADAEEAPATDNSDESSEPVITTNPEAIALTPETPEFNKETTELAAATELAAEAELTEATDLAEVAESSEATIAVDPAEAIPPLLNLEVPPLEQTEPATDISAPDSDPWEPETNQAATATELNEIAAPDVNTADIVLETDVIASPEAVEPPPVQAFLEVTALTEADTELPASNQTELKPPLSEAPEVSNEANNDTQPEPIAPFEDRFSLSNAADLEASDAPRDAMDIELDNRLQDNRLLETRMEDEPSISLTPADNDRLDLVFESAPAPEMEPRNSFQDAIAADEAAFLTGTSEGQLLNGEELTRHLESEFDDKAAANEIAPPEAKDIAETDPESIAEAESSNNTDGQEPLPSNPLEVGSLPQDRVSLDLTANSLRPETTLQPRPDNTQGISQVSSLMAGLVQLNNANPDANPNTQLSLPSIDAIETNPAANDGADHSEEPSSDETQPG